MKKKLFLFCFLIAILALAIAFYILSLPPKEKLSKEFKEEAATKLLGRKVQLDDTTAKGVVEYTGKYIQFKYPARAVVYTYKGASSSAILEDFSFDIKEPKMVFNMQVIDASNFVTVADFPAVNLRKLRSYEYKEEKFKINDASGLVFFKQENGVEKSGFLISKNKLYSFVVTGQDETEVNKLFDDIIHSSLLKTF